MTGRKINFTPIEELFGGSTPDDAAHVDINEQDTIVDINKTLEWHTEINIPGVKVHPFNRLPEAKKLELQKSIEKNGLISPIILREDPADGYYEIIAGHNRIDALKDLGYETLSTKKGEIKILRDCDDIMAAYCMLDSNIQREELLPSERADAYATKYELIRMELRHNPEFMSHSGTNQKRSDEIAAEMMGVSRTTLQRYLSLKKLIPELAVLVDEKKIGIPTAEIISSIQEEQQEELLIAIKETKVPGLALVKKIKSDCDQQFYEAAELCEMISPSSPPTKINLQPIFKLAARELEDLDVQTDQIDQGVLQNIVTEAIKGYLNQFITGNEKM